MATDRAVTFEAYYPAPLDDWYELRAWPSPDGLSVYFLDVTARRVGQQSATAAARRAQLVAEVTSELSATLDTRRRSPDSQLLVHELADWCLVTLVDDDGASARRRVGAPRPRRAGAHRPQADLLLGIDPSSVRNETTVTLERGSTVLLYTDGLVERRGQSLDEGLERLRALLGELAHLSLEDLCDALLARLLPRSSDDDVALVAVRLHHQDRPRPSEAGPGRVPPEVPPEAG